MQKRPICMYKQMLENMCPHLAPDIFRCQVNRARWAGKWGRGIPEKGCQNVVHKRLIHGSSAL